MGDRWPSCMMTTSTRGGPKISPAKSGIGGAAYRRAPKRTKQRAGRDYK